jgi:hypothetical protein
MSNRIDGLIDELRVYNRVLSEEEVQNLFGSYQYQVKSIDIIEPANNVIWDEGTQNRIEWVKTGEIGDTISIEYSADRVDWITINDNVAGNIYYYDTPYVSSDMGFYLRVSSNDYPSINDEIYFNLRNLDDSITIPIKTINIDGLPSDWDGIIPIIIDSESDSYCETGTDITQLFLAQDDHYLYWRVDTASGEFSFGSNGQEKLLVLLFYETTYPNGPYPNGITVNLNSPTNGFVSARYDNYDWIGLYGGIEYGRINQIAEGKIALTDFNPFKIEYLNAYYWRGADADPQCDDAIRYGELLLNDGILAILDITSPVENEVIDEESYIWIRWDKNETAGETVKIEYSRDGVDWLLINSSVAGDRHYWQVPGVSSDMEFQLKVTSNDHPDVYDINTFTIRAIEVPEIRITEPDNGEEWDEGTYEWITWDKNDAVGNTVKIEYSRDGVDWLTINNSVAGDRHYWQVPGVSSDMEFQMKITSNDHPDVYDINTFTIRAIEVPEIRITEPDNGEVWNEGTYQWITWDKNDAVGDTVRIEYSRDGVDWLTIHNSVGGDRYYWQVFGVSSDMTFQLKITSNDHPSVYDINSFTIRAN